MLLQSFRLFILFFWQKLTHFLFLSASDTRHSALSRDLFALNWKRAATTNKKFHLFANKIKNKKLMKEERKQTKKPQMKTNKWHHCFILFWLFVIAWTSINFAPFLHFCLLFFAFLLTHPSSHSLITLCLAVSLFDFSFLSKSCDVSDGLITLERVDNTSARCRDNDNDNDAVSNANDETVAAADVLSSLIVQGS